MKCARCKAKIPMSDATESVVQLALAPQMRIIRRCATCRSQDREAAELRIAELRVKLMQGCAAHEWSNCDAGGSQVCNICGAERNRTGRRECPFF